MYMNLDIRICNKSYHVKFHCHNYQVRQFTILNDYIRNTTAVCGNVATVGYNSIRANSNRLHKWGELFEQIEAHHH